ncbi:MAG: glycosyltransferase, partial [Pelagibacteraceae bacterium]|nr:glycosyltransferase [Pelagibacteraceae bacterium]
MRTFIFINATRQAKINLVLRGNQNSIPYRFYEVLYLKAFFLIDSGILNYQLSNNFENKESFVFENLEQLYSLINFYLKHDDEREFLLS